MKATSIVIITACLAACNTTRENGDGPGSATTPGGGSTGSVSQSTGSEEVSEAVAAYTVAQVLCQARADCGCLGGKSVEACSDLEQANWSIFQTEAQSHGLTYDGACLADKLDVIRDQGCGAENLCALIDCRTYYGQLPVDAECGESCPNYLDMASPCDAASDCGQGLVCVEYSGTSCVPLPASSDGIAVGWCLTEADLCGDKAVHVLE
jgi:hypothetical protein